jgi:hypothetical protein
VQIWGAWNGMEENFTFLCCLVMFSCVYVSNRRETFIQELRLYVYQLFENHKMSGCIDVGWVVPRSDRSYGYTTVKGAMGYWLTTVIRATAIYTLKERACMR